MGSSNKKILVYWQNGTPYTQQIIESLAKPRQVVQMFHNNYTMQMMRISMIYKIEA
jgi:hypothetical protein